VEILLSSALIPFSSACVFVALILVFELIWVLATGVGLTHLLEMTFDVDSLPDSPLLDWFLVKELPFSVVLLLGVGLFGACGIAVQAVAHAIDGAPLPLYLSVPLAITGMALGSRKAGSIVAPLFKTETMAVSHESLLGRVGVLKSPVAKRGLAGELKVYDEFGQAHFVQVEPLNDEVLYVEGQQVQLVKTNGFGFLGQAV
jgi:hypothetical protein